MNEVENTNATESTEVEVSASEITFSDGTKQKFGKRTKSVKAVNVEAQTVTFYVRNGQAYVFDLAKVSPEILIRLALHGAAQKIGDSAASLEEEGDIFEAIEETGERVTRGEWDAERAKGEFSGISDLIRAVMAVTGKDAETVRATLKKMSPAEKTQLKGNSKVKTELDRIHQEKLEKLGPADGESLLAKFA